MTVCMYRDIHTLQLYIIILPKFCEHSLFPRQSLPHKIHSPNNTQDLHKSLTFSLT